MVQDASKPPCIRVNGEATTDEVDAGNRNQETFG
jgi:hypothetical protein